VLLKPSAFCAAKRDARSCKQFSIIEIEDCLDCLSEDVDRYDLNDNEYLRCKMIIILNRHILMEEINYVNVKLFVCVC